MSGNLHILLRSHRILEPSESKPVVFHLFHCSMDWLKGKSTGNHRFSHEIWGFPVDFPLSQSIELSFHGTGENGSGVLSDPELNLARTRTRCKGKVGKAVKEFIELFAALLLFIVQLFPDIFMMNSRCFSYFSRHFPYFCSFFIFSLM